MKQRAKKRATSQISATSIGAVVQALLMITRAEPHAVMDDETISLIDRIAGSGAALPQTPEEWDLHIELRKTLAGIPLGLTQSKAEELAEILSRSGYAATVAQRIRARDQRRARGAGLTTTSEKSARIRARRSAKVA